MLQNSPLVPPPTFRYAIVEDEAVARLHLKRMLERLAPEARLIWEAEDGDVAIRHLVTDPVDVLFLDVIFPPEGAFHLLGEAQERQIRLPKIVFVTGRDEHAVKAFDWAACDYLLKPLTPDRVKATLDRVRSSLVSPEVGALLHAVRTLGKGGLPERFSVSIRDRILVFRWSEVMYLHTEFRQVYAHTARGKVPLDRPMDELEVLLGERFVRIHRSSLINLDYLVEVRNPPSRAGEALMQDGAALSVSRARMDDLILSIQRMC